MKILYVTTVGATMNFFYDEFVHLLEQGHTIEIACCSSWNYSERIASLNLKHYEIPFSRLPLARDNFKAYRDLKKLVNSERYNIVHCHTPNAATITRLACRKIRNMGTRVIYTAHGFHFYQGAPIFNWLIFYPVEWICAHWTDVLITINQEDYLLAQKKIKAVSVRYVPGVGINIDKFIMEKSNQKNKREQLGIPQNATILLSIGELNDNKNHKVVIQAISGLDVYYLIAGKGSNEEELKNVAMDVGMSERVRILGYRTDISELLSITDIFVFPSFREGLSVSLMEAMASSRVAVVSRIRGNVDLIDSNGGELFDPHKVEECRSAITTVMKADKKKMGEYNFDKIQGFSVNNIERVLDTIYGGEE